MKNQQITNWNGTILPQPLQPNRQFQAWANGLFLCQGRKWKDFGVKVGVVAVVERGGVVQAGMKIHVEQPDIFVKMERI